jgi:hypothetical protein
LTQVFRRILHHGVAGIVPAIPARASSPIGTLTQAASSRSWTAPRARHPQGGARRLAGRVAIPRLTLYHGARNVRDARHAQRLADLPGASAITLEDYAGHDSQAHLTAQQKLDAVYAEFLAHGAG